MPRVKREEMSTWLGSTLRMAGEQQHVVEREGFRQVRRDLGRRAESFSHYYSGGLRPRRSPSHTRSRGPHGPAPLVWLTRFRSLAESHIMVAHAPWHFLYFLPLPQ